MATDGTKELKSRLAVRGGQEVKSLSLENFAPTASERPVILYYAS